MIKGCEHFGSKHLQLCGRAHYRATRKNLESRTNPLNALQEAIHYSFIKFYIYCFYLWYEFFVHNAMRVGKKTSSVYDCTVEDVE